MVKMTCEATTRSCFWQHWGIYEWLRAFSCLKFLYRRVISYLLSGYSFIFQDNGMNEIHVFRNFYTNWSSTTFFVLSAPMSRSKLATQFLTMEYHCKFLAVFSIGKNILSHLSTLLLWNLHCIMSLSLQICSKHYIIRPQSWNLGYALRCHQNIIIKKVCEVRQV